jgi:GTP-binding protein
MPCIFVKYLRVIATIIEQYRPRSKKMSYSIRPNSANFLMGISKIEQLESWLDSHPEAVGICFVGRSNVGKSSIINSMFGNKTARVSKTPGRTREINIFNFQLNLNNKEFSHPEIFMIDLPGYGFAEVSKEMSKNWNQLMGSYFMKISPHFMIVNIQDSRHPDQASDREFYKFVSTVGNEVILLFNKIDKLKTQKERAELQKLIPGLSKAYKWIRQMYFVSAETKQGMEPVNEVVINYILQQLEFVKSKN